MPAHGKRHKAQLLHFIFYGAQLFKALVREYMLCPALGGRQFHIMEAGRRNALQRIFNGIAVIAVRIHADDPFCHLSTAFLQNSALCSFSFQKKRTKAGARFAPASAQKQPALHLAGKVVVMVDIVLRRPRQLGIKAQLGILHAHTGDKLPKAHMRERRAQIG